MIRLDKGEAKYNPNGVERPFDILFYGDVIVLCIILTIASAACYSCNSLISPHGTLQWVSVKKIRGYFVIPRKTTVAGSFIIILLFGVMMRLGTMRVLSPTSRDSASRHNHKETDEQIFHVCAMVIF